MGSVLMPMLPGVAPPGDIWVPRCYLTKILEGFSGPTDPTTTLKFRDLHGSLQFRSNLCLNPPSKSVNGGPVRCLRYPPELERKYSTYAKLISSGGWYGECEDEWRDSVNVEGLDSSHLLSLRPVL